MPVYRLTEDLIFPSPELADKDGLLAIGGDLTFERLVLAYSNGIFPWYSEDEPILWWSPNPRCVIFPPEIKISKSMKKLLKKDLYKVTFDRCFREVITICGELRADNTWINEDIIEAYCMLHREGLAHSVETWYGDKLVGGLYGVSFGKCFFGESMFSIMENASKTALITLAKRLYEMNFVIIDCQVYNKHLESMGAVEISRKSFLKHLSKGLREETLRGSWNYLDVGAEK